MIHQPRVPIGMKVWHSGHQKVWRRCQRSLDRWLAVQLTFLSLVLSWKCCWHSAKWRQQVTNRNTKCMEDGTSLGYFGISKQEQSWFLFFGPICSSWNAGSSSVFCSQTVVQEERCGGAEVQHVFILDGRSCFQKAEARGMAQPTSIRGEYFCFCGCSEWKLAAMLTSKELGIVSPQNANALASTFPWKETQNLTCESRQFQKNPSLALQTNLGDLK